MNKSIQSIILVNLLVASLCFLALPVFNVKAQKNQENFTIIVLPDTQYYSENYSWIFENQTQWIIENKESKNIVFVTHLGDLVDHWWSIDEWENANKSMSKLEGIPYGVLPGNHDGTRNNDEIVNYNKYFGFSRFQNKSWYGGAYQNINTNNYQLFSAGGEDYLIFHIQFKPTDEILTWASNIIDQHPNKKIIISTHNFVHGFGLFSNSRSEIGENMWKKLVKPHADQIFLVLSGHYENEVRITSLVDGYYVHQLLSDYQDRKNGGNGWLRIISFSTSTNEILIQTYSTSLNQYETDSNSQFILDEKITESKLLVTRVLFSIIPISIIIFVAYFIQRKIREKLCKTT